MVGEGLFAGRLGSIRLGRGSAAHSRVIDVMLESELMLADSATGTAEVAALIHDVRSLRYGGRDLPRSSSSAF
jgi:hypothetical protein